MKVYQRKVPDPVPGMSVQRRTTKTLKDLEGKCSKEQQRSLGMFSTEQTEGRPHCSLKLSCEEKRGADADFCSVLTSDGTPGN